MKRTPKKKRLCDRSLIAIILDSQQDIFTQLGVPKNQFIELIKKWRETNNVVDLPQSAQ